MKPLEIVFSVKKTIRPSFVERNQFLIHVLLIPEKMEKQNLIWSPKFRPVDKLARLNLAITSDKNRQMLREQQKMNNFQSLLACNLKDLLLKQAENQPPNNVANQILDHAHKVMRLAGLSNWIRSYPKKQSEKKFD